jgi:hypothetical protein
MRQYVPSTTGNNTNTGGGSNSQLYQANSSMLEKKRSYERLMRLDQQLYNIYKTGSNG